MAAAVEIIELIQYLLTTRGDVAGVTTRIIKSGRKTRDIAVIRGRTIRKAMIEIEIEVRDANPSSLSQKMITK